MSIKQKIYDCIEITKCTGIPFLIMSNPGYGKTTDISDYVKEHNYHMETLIGSQSTPEEILGYSVNDGGNCLKDLNPKWFERLKGEASKNVRTVLFCDELSTCPTQVQGALLSLIFDRRIKSGEYLPKDTIIIAAANYSGNLPEYMEIISPNINRFCVLNLVDRMTGLDICDELFSEKAKKAQLRTFIELSDTQNEKFYSRMEEFVSGLFKMYSDKDSADGFLDIRNTKLAGLYQETEKVYNFLSLRSLSYFTAIMKACIENNIADFDFISSLVEGIIGWGTGNFSSDESRNKYVTVCVSSMKTLFNEIFGLAKSRKSEKSFDFGENTVSNLVEKLMKANETTSNILDTDEGNQSKKIFADIEKCIAKDYGLEIKALIDMNENPEKKAKFISDFESIIALILKEKDSGEFDMSQVVAFGQLYDTYYRQMIAKNDKLIPDVNRQSVFENFRSTIYRTSMIAINRSLDVKDVLNMNETELTKNIKTGKIIQVGLRKVDGPLYKMTFGQPVFMNKLGTPIGDDYNLLKFDNGTLTTMSQFELKSLM